MDGSSRDFDNLAEKCIADTEFQIDAPKEKVLVIFQSFRRDRRRNAAKRFFETAKRQYQSPPFVGNFGAAAMRTAGAGEERRTRQKIIDRVDRIPGGLIAEPGYFRRLGDALVLHHGFEQGDALASDKKPPADAPSQHAIDLSRQVTRHSVLPKSARYAELSSSGAAILVFRLIHLRPALTMAR